MADKTLLTNFLYDGFWWVVAGGTSFAVWLGRLIFTNNKRLDLLEQENKHARELRESQDSAIQEIRTDQKKIVQHLLNNK